VIDDIAEIIRTGGCVVMGVGVTPEKYRLMLEDAISQNYLVIGAKTSKDASFIASKMSGEILKPKPLTILGLGMSVYLIQNEKAATIAA
jgi:hypothetical protein